MKSTRGWIAAGFLFLAAWLVTVPAFANPITVQLISVGGNNQNGFYTYPYYLSLNHGPVIPMSCDDFYDESGPGDAWQAHLTALSGGNVSKTMFANLHAYEEAGYLLLQTKRVDPSQWASINWAIWKIFDPNLDPGYQYDRQVDFWLNRAEEVDLSKIDFSSIEIPTPNTKGHQEFLFMTPEPGTLLLLGSGLLGFWTLRRHLA